MKTFPHIRRALAGKLWYVHEQKMQEMLAFLEIKLAGGATAPEVIEQIRATNQAAAARAQARGGGSGATMVIPIYGMIMHRQMADISGGSSGTSCQAISASLRQAVDDPGVSQIVLDIDSPGGDVDGVDELASEILAARKQKKITAVSNCLCASAAYYLASQASEIVASPSSLTGSIGVYTMHEDDSAMLESLGIKLELIKFGENKAEGNSLGPLTDSARAHLQETVDIYGNAFEKAVARGRGIKQDDVHKKFGQGRVFDAKTAVRIGMADRVGTLADVLGQASGGSRGSAAAEMGQPEVVSAEAAFSVDGALTPEARFVQTAVDGAIRAAAESIKASERARMRVLKGDTDPDEMCMCDCEPCDGDCEGCTCEGCDCEACSCEAATKARKTKAEHAKMRHQLAVAGA